MARADNGTRCSRPAFMRAPGIVQTLASRSTSGQVASSTSLVRVAVTISSSNARRTEGLASAVRSAWMNAGTAAYGSAAWWGFSPQCFGSTLFRPSVGLSPLRNPDAFVQSKTTLMRCFTRRAVSGSHVQIGASTFNTSDASIASTGDRRGAGNAYCSSDAEPLRAVLRVAEGRRVGGVHLLRGLFERRHRMAIPLAIGERILAGARVASELRGLLAGVGERRRADAAQPEVAAFAFRFDHAAPHPSFRAGVVDDQIQAVAIGVLARRVQVANPDRREPVVRMSLRRGSAPVDVVCGALTHHSLPRFVGAVEI